MANVKILQGIIDEIANKAKESASIVLVDYQGLTVGETNELRRKLRDTGSDLKIYKNTLTKRALDSLNIDLGELGGPKAVAFGTDAVAPIKVLSDYAKDHPALALKIGYVDGAVADETMLKSLSQIPSREGLLTMLAGGLMQTVKEFAIALDLHAQNLEK